MQLAGTTSWRIGTDEPQSLLVALYVRDVAGLLAKAESDIPPLVPATPFGGIRSSAEITAATQWAEWWLLLLQGGGFWPDDKRPSDFPILIHDPEIQRLFFWPSRNQSPDFYGLSDMPELQVLVRRYFETARIWSEARHLEFAALSTARQRVLLESDIVRSVERGLGRTARTFALDIRVLPVAGVQAWRLSSSRALVTRALFGDRAAYSAWLRLLIEELA